MAWIDLSELRMFEIALEWRYRAPRQRVWAAFVQEHGAWWPHKFAPGGEYRLEPFVGGRIYQEWGPGLGALLGFVSYLDEPGVIVLTGVPSGLGFALGRVVIRLDEEGDETIFRYRVENLGRLGPEADQGYTTALQHLYGEVFRAYVEDPA